MSTKFDKSLKANLSELNTVAMKEVMSYLNEKIAEHKAADIQAAREALENLARESDLTIDEILGKSTSPGKKPARYINPQDPTKTWSGMGAQPNWYKDALAAGVPQESMLIHK